MRRLIAVGSAVVALAGCGAGAERFDDEKLAADVAELDLATSSVELDGLDRLDPVQAAAALVAAPSKPCRTRTLDAVDPSVVHVVLEGCTGRFGRHVVNGELTLTFSANADGTLHSDSVSDWLTIDDRPLSRVVAADIWFEGDERYASRHADKIGTKANGDSFVHTSDDTVVTNLTTHCRTVNGTGEAVVDGTRRIESTITDLQSCDGPDDERYCPSGLIEHVNFGKHKTVLVTFDGSATASIEISKPRRERSEIWELGCVAAP